MAHAPAHAVHQLAGLGAPLLASIVVTTLVVALASLRHMRQALALQPIEALG
jgi:hypothetical protein